MISHLKLYHYLASRSARALWVIHECGLDVEVVSLDLYAGTQYTPDYRARNPFHHVPLLEVQFADGTELPMIESGAMVAWLADAVPDKELAPPPGLTAERADYMQMLHFGASGLDMMLWQVRSHEHVLPPEDRVPAVAERYRAKIRNEAEPMLTARLEKGGFICGERFTAADCVIGHDVMWARGYGLCQDAVFKAYLSRISKRRAFVAAFADARAFTPVVPEDSALSRNFTG